MTTPTSDNQLVAAVAEIGASLLAATEGHVDADHLVAVAARALPHADDASLTVVRTGRPPETAASTGEVPREVDRIQYAIGDGPCLDAIDDDDFSRADDLTTDEQWPRFAREVVEQTPVRSVLGVRLRMPGDQRAALNFYANQPNRFTDLDLGVAAILSTFVSLALQRESAKRTAENLEKALQSNRQIGAAMGVLMARHLMTADDAFAQLRASSQHLQRKLRDIAQHVVETGELPER